MRRLLAIAIALVVPSIVLDARAGSLEDDLNAFLSPVTIDEQRERAIQSASEVLSKVRSPQLAFSIDLSLVSSLAQKLPAISYEGVTVKAVTADRQLVRVDVAFDKVFDAIAIGGIPIPELVAQLKPRIVGSAVIYLGVTSSATSSADQNVIRLRLLPALHSVRIDRVEVADITVPNLLVGLINLVNAFADRISSYLSSLPICDITLPASPSSTVALPDSLVVRAPDGEPIAVQLRSRSVPVPVSIIAIAWLVDVNSITALVRLNTKPTVGQAPSRLPTNFEDLSTSFTNLLTDGGFSQRPTSTGVWVELRKDVVGYSISRLIDALGICAAAKADIPPQQFSSKIRIPDETTVACKAERECSGEQISCEPTRDCTPTGSCDLKNDTRDCRRCTSVFHCHGLFKKCGWEDACINEPTCEVAKAAQNRVYEADKLLCETGKSAKKADCESLKQQDRSICEIRKAAWKADCERIKTTNKALCEAEKETLKRLSRTGKFGNISGTAGGHADVAVCIKSLTLSDDLTSGRATVGVGGDATATVALRFVPLDIIGHLSCQVPWRDDFKLTAHVPTQDVELEASVTSSLDRDKLRYDVSMSHSELEFSVQPPLQYLLVWSPNFALSCSPLAGLLTTIAIPLGPFIPELQGKFKYKSKPLTISYRPDNPTIELGGSEVEVSTSTTPNTIVLKAQL